MKYFHRVIFYSLLVLSLVWACFALKTNPFLLLYNFEFFESVKFIYILGGTAVFWPIFYVEIIDYLGVVDQIRRWMAVPQPVDTTQFTGWRTGIPSPIS
ncbi:MAG: hypothetical protein E7J86_21920, partial [Aeromonas caviae]|nr:hypothetical protein [Aeromonas caviae]